jgi:hypothetical protein
MWRDGPAVAVILGVALAKVTRGFRALAVLALPLAVHFLSSCSRGEGTAARREADSTGGAAVERDSPCEPRALGPQDITGLLVIPIRARRAVPGDPQSCEYTTDGFPSVTLSIRPGRGTATVDAWMDGKMALPVTALPAVGDRALWQATLHEVIADRKGTLCDIQIRAGEKDLALRPEALARALGAICNRVFAAQ